MDFDAEFEIFQRAEAHFVENNYPQSEPLLNQLVLRSTKKAEVFHMLGTIYYDQGKFNKAIRAFKRALEINPAFTDSSIGLSIILNDLGRYDEGQKVFNEARAMLAVRNPQKDATLEERFSQKHDELAALYFQHDRFEDALEQFQKALILTQIRRPELLLQIANCLSRLGKTSAAIKELRQVIRDYPQFVPAQLKLGKCYHDLQQIPEAISCWEAVLNTDPQNPEAKEYLHLTHATQVTQLTSPTLEI